MGPGIEPKIKQDSLILHLNMYIECKYQLSTLKNITFMYKYLQIVN